MAACSVEGCNRPRHSLKFGLCEAHYWRMRRYGDPRLTAASLKPALSPFCKKEGCKKKRYALGLCCAHYTKNRRFGDFAAGKDKNREQQDALLRFAGFVGDDCIQWPFNRTPRGDGVTYFRGKRTSASRAVCILAHGEPPTSKHEAAHSCGRGHEACMNPRHLRWATHKENLADKLLHGTVLRGEAHHMAKLTVAQVREIRRLLPFYKNSELARRFGVSDASIRLIETRKNWAWLP